MSNTRTVSAVLSLLGLLACDGSSERAAASGATTGASARAALGERALVVAEADRLAVAAAKQRGEERAHSRRRAASLRERLWRRDGKPADALEAVDLLEQLAADGAAPCEAALRGKVLAAELASDPTQLARALRKLQASPTTPDCAARLRQALSTLSAYGAADDSPDVVSGHARSTADSHGDSVVLMPKNVDQTGPLLLTKVERYGAKASARIVVYLTRPSLFEVGRVAATSTEPHRLYVDINGAEHRGPTRLPMQGLVSQVRLGRHQGATRVVLDLAEPAQHRIFYLPEPFRLVIDVSRGRPQENGGAERTRQVRRIVLDPGHGGHDPGAVGPGGLREKDVTLDIAHRAAPLLARELNVATLLTRDTDAFVPLDERSQRANAFHADLFISIHCNASEDHSSKGIMTFVLDASPDAAASQIAARENAASAEAASELANVMSRALDRQSLEMSSRFASLLQRASMASLGPRYPAVKDHGVRSAGFYVLAGASMPAVLYEASFISNPREEAWLNTADYRQRVADALVNAVRAYRDGL